MRYGETILYPKDDSVYTADIIPPVKEDILIKQEFQAIRFPYSGVVLDNVNGNPIPGASVYIFIDGTKAAGMQTNSKGEFYLETIEEASSITISHASYLPLTLKPSVYLNENFYIAEMKRDEKILNPVELPSTPRKNYDWVVYLTLGAAWVKESQSSKRVGAISKETVTTVATAGTFLIGFLTLKKLLEGIGIFQTQDGKDFDAHLSNPYSFWNPLFWQQGGEGTKLLTAATCAKMINDINGKFQPMGDDEDGIFAIFKSNIKTQSQLSFLAWWTQKELKMDLLEWLKGSDYWPNDHLSVSEIAVITDYVEKLPKYK